MIIFLCWFLCEIQQLKFGITYHVGLDLVGVELPIAMTSSGEVSDGAGGWFMLVQVSEALVMVGLVLCGGWGEADQHIGSV